jgi:hypothetical protein
VTVCPEEVSVKPGSPGFVADDEQIVHILFDPDNFKDGEFQPGKIGIARLKKSEWSIARPKYTTLQTIETEVIAQRTKSGSVVYAGCIRATCRDLRWINAQSECGRIVCVFDDPILPNFVGHGLMGFSQVTKADKYWAKADKKNNTAAVLLHLCSVFEKGGYPLRLEECFPVTLEG